MTADQTAAQVKASKPDRAADRAEPYDAFVSYAREDQVSVRRLYTAMVEHGKRVFVDWDIPLWSPDWSSELRGAIDAAHSVIFMVSPDALASQNVRIELDYAVSRGKRITPILIRSVDGLTVPSELEKPQWSDFRDESGFDKNVLTLIESLDTDVAWVERHTRLLLRATEWEKRGRDKSLLLRGGDLADAERWLSNRGARTERPFELQTQYIFASRLDATRRQRTVLAGVSAGFLVAIALALVAVVQRNDAIAQRREATRQASLAQSRELAATATVQGTTDPELAVLLASRGAQLAPTREATQSLRQSLAALAQRGTLASHRGPVVSAGFGAVSSEVMTADHAGVHLWDTARRRDVADIPVKGKVWDAALSPDGHLIVVGREHGSALAYNAKTRQLAFRIPGDALGFTNSVRFSADGRFVVTATFERAVRVFDIRQRRTIATLTLGSMKAIAPGVQHLDPRVAAISPDGRLVAVASDAPCLWRVGATVPQVTLGRRPASDVAFSPDGRSVATATFRGADIWRASTGRLEAHLPGNDVTSVAFSPNGRVLVTGQHDGASVVWSIGSRRITSLLSRHAGNVNSARFSHDGHLVVTSSDDGTARVWAVGNKGTGVRLGAASRPDRFLSFSWDGRIAMTRRPDGTPAAWDLRRPHNPTPMVGASRGFVGFSPDGSLVALKAESTLGIWRVDRGRQISTLRSQPATRHIRIAFSHDDREVVTAPDNGGPTRIWNVSSGAWVATLKNSLTPTFGAVFSPNGRLLVTASLDNVDVWNTESWQEVQRLGNDVQAYSVWFTPDGRFLVTAGSDGRVRAWDVATFRETSTFRMSEVGAVGFGPGDQMVLSSQGHGDPVVWDIRHNEVFPDFIQLQGHVADVAFAPSGDAVLVASRRSVISRFPCDICGSLRQLLVLAHERVTRALTSGERAQFLHEEGQS